MSQASIHTDEQWTTLRKRPLFSTLTEKQWSKLKPLMHRRAHQEGDLVLTASNQSRDLFWIESGRVSVTRETPFGEQLLAELKEDDAFGEIALIDGKGHTADVRASGPATVFQMDGDALELMFQDDHPLACHFYRYFWRTLSEKIHLANNQLKQFFDSNEPEPPKHHESPSRPSWFAPPDGTAASAGATPTFEMPLEEKRQPLVDRGLSSEEIDLLFARGEELFVDAEEKIFREGDFGDTLYFILHGEVRISKDLPGVGPEALAILEAGEIFGEMAIVAENAVRSADSLAHEKPVLLLAFRRNVLNKMQGQGDADYAFLQAICKTMSHRLREINDKLVSWKMMRGGFF